MVPRKVTQLLRQRMDRFPAVALIGPRQAGKTTLAKSLAGVYFDLEQEGDRLRLDLQWSRLCDGPDLVILDEAQAWPVVFPRLRVAIDRDRARRGRFLLLGSISPSLMVQVSESLAGRLSLVELSPFLLNELAQPDMGTLWCCGGYPEGGVLDRRQFPQWQQDYLTLLCQRDLPNWGLPATSQVTQRLFRMLAAVHGQLWNASRIGQSMGLSYATVNRYMDYLEGAFLIRRLQPYRANLRKRLIRSPKVYWRDSGLLHALLKVANEDDLPDNPWVGASWEGFVIEQILGWLGQTGRRAEPFFLRTSDRHEIDFVLDWGKSLWAIEVKLTGSPSAGDLRRLGKTADMIAADKRILISQTPEVICEGNRVSCNLPWFLGFLETEG